MPVTEHAMVAAAVLLLGAVAASLLTRRVGVPALVLFIGLGMAAGSEGLGGIEFTDHELTQAVGVVALAMILFSGGLETDVERVRPSLAPAVSMATVGVAVTCGIVGWVAHLVLDIDLRTGLLIGAIVSSTDAAAVFSVLKAQATGFRGELQPVLELESGCNDPMAVFLTLGLLTLITDPSASGASLVALLVGQIVVGAIVGVVLARVAIWGLNLTDLGDDGLYPVMTLGIALLVFGVAASLGGSGFLAVYLAGVIIGNRRIVRRHTILQFHGALAWLSEIAMFLVLGLLAFPSKIAAVAVEGAVLALVLVVVARPLATFVALPTRRFTLRGRLLLGWVGLRGAVPIVLATYALAEDIPHAELIFDVVFFMVMASVVLQGTTVARAARALQVDAPAAPPQRSVLVYNPVDSRTDMTVVEFTVDVGSLADGARVVDLDVPDGTLLLLVMRADTALIPEGNSELAGGDRVLALTPAGLRGELAGLFSGTVDA